jgi:antirestriction protein ArdC
MKAEEVKKLADTAIQELEEALKAGKSDAMERYLKALSSFHRYSFGNAMLIAFQRPHATHVAGFQTWKSLGRFVKAGEKGIAIMAPMMLNARKKETASAEAITTSDTPEKILRFRVVHVFDVSQTDGAALPEPVRVSGDPGDRLSTLKAFTASQGIVLEYADNLGGADGLSLKGKVQLRSGMNAGEEFSVLVHELAHELLHRSDSDARPSKTVRETEAEAVAFVVGTSIGLSPGTASSDYIQLYGGSVELLQQSLSRIQRAATHILSALSDLPASVEAGV